MEWRLGYFLFYVDRDRDVSWVTDDVRLNSIRTSFNSLYKRTSCKTIQTLNQSHQSKSSVKMSISFLALFFPSQIHWLTTTTTKKGFLNGIAMFFKAFNTIDTFDLITFLSLLREGENLICAIFCGLLI